MNILEKLKENFSDILEAYFEKEGSLLFLRIKTNHTDLLNIEKISKQISDFLDVYDHSEKEYYLDVFSKGEDLKIEIDKLDSFISKKLQIWKDENSFIIGKLLENNEEHLLLEVNLKGRIKKETILKKDIYKINLYIKI
ncbi:ribosome assembly cofactor RimP [Mesomycoplasma molare]|uniref:Ribosome assembly cofactor RimP n=1 Tax=Mesomycoplasma molare TaxID=171288 RepID=A0ABY5TUY4_9BACT|nr:ribosome assembly cofactor RimP [Mesomycoplasma molare]UWD34365.1 ribosome assembly cofactor RimP [Mesomycoplasma molare]